MKTFKVNPLNRKTVSQTIEELKAYRESLKQFPAVYAKAMTERLTKILGYEAPASVNGCWSSYVNIYSDGKASGIIEFDGKVEFVEFGTGVVGKYNNGGINQEWLSKLPPPYTEYNAGPRIHHFEDENLDYWTYFDGTKWVSTHGMPADPFIYRSVKELMSEHVKIAKEAFAYGNIGEDFGIEVGE